ncbi:MAG: hypothetical protein E6G08_05035 [Actinobacteria bacterium]|nr:MAG: hypothetical protein E6G08_05035 [Actinomycetota bacterium]
MSNETIDAANDVLRAKGYDERDLAAFPTPMGPDRAILKGARILSPFSDDAATVLRVATELVPPAAELKGTLRPADLRAKL